MIYAYVGRFADARDAIARAWSVHDRSGAKPRWALGAGLAGHIEQIAGNPPAAGHHLQEAHKALRTIGEQGFLSTVAGMLAEALYVQGRLDEERQITGEARAAAAPDDVDALTRWRVVRAKILARGGQFPAARALLDQAAALVSPTSWATLQAQVLMARTEVDRLAGTPEQAQASLRAALRTATDRHATRSPTRPQPPSTALPAIRRSANTRTAATGVRLRRGT